AVGDRRARRAASSVVRPEHVVIDEKLRTSSKEVCQRGFPVLGLESVLLVDPDPGQLPPLPRQVVTAASVLLLRLEQLESRCQPFFTRSRLLLCHRSSLSLSVFVIVAIVLDEGLQSTDRRIPFGRDLVEGAPRLLETLGLQLVDPLASATEISHQPNAAKGAQLLGDCLASDAGTLAEVRDGKRTSDTEPAD